VSEGLNQNVAYVYTTSARTKSYTVFAAVQKLSVVRFYNVLIFITDTHRRTDKRPPCTRKIYALQNVLPALDLFRIYPFPSHHNFTSDVVKGFFFLATGQSVKNTSRLLPSNIF